MGSCKLDHSFEDVKKKYESQIDFLPEETRPMFKELFQKGLSQELLNEVFHLLKKYDLASEEEREVRNQKILLIIQNVERG